MANDSSTKLVSVAVKVEYKKDLVELLKEELTRLHALVEKGVQGEWAKERIRDIQRAITSPDAVTIARAIQSELAKDPEEFEAVEALSTPDPIGN